MTFQEAYNFFESLKTETSKKSEIKVYEKLLHILTELEGREFSKDEIHSIEKELDSFNLKSNRENNIRFFKRALSKLEKFLKNTFSLTSKGYYTKLFGGLGLTFGLLFGVVFLTNWERSLGISMGMLAGMLVGSIIGRYMDSKAMSEGKVI